MAAALRDGRWSGRLERRRKDGLQFTAGVTLTPRAGPGGPPCGFVLVSSDVTAQVRMSRDLEDAQAYARSLIESAPDAMVIVDAGGLIQLANAETERLFGHTREELIGRRIEMLIPRRFHDQHPAHRRDFFAAPRARPMGAGIDLWGMRRDGSEFPVEVSLSPLQTEAGPLATAAIRDVTEARRVQRELREANLHLEAASRAKDRFLASMSHELRTPLNAILGFTGTLLMGLPGPLNDEQDKQLRIVQTSGRHLLSLINDLLDLARIESGKLELTPVEIDGRELLGEVALGLRPLANAKQVELQGRRAARRHRRQRPARAQPDPHQPRQQRDQVHRKGRSSGSSWQQDSGDDGGRTRFTVTDTGHRHQGGGPDEAVRGVRAGRGDGVLPLRGHRPRAPHLPDARAAAGRRDLVHEHVRRGQRIHARAPGGERMAGRILVIEDNEENLTLVDYLLRAHGYDTLLARNGTDGLQLATSAHPDLILLDVRMPFMDGYEVARALRADHALDPVPIVAVTASAMVGDRERIARAGFDHYVQKPIDPETFIAEIRRCIDAGSRVNGRAAP